MLIVVKIDIEMLQIYHKTTMQVAQGLHFKAITLDKIKEAQPIIYSKRWGASFNADSENQVRHSNQW